MQLGNSLNTSYAYYPWNQQGGRLQSLTTGSVQGLSYRYDAVGNILAITDTTNSNQVQTFTYDSLDRLKTASTNAAGLGQYSASYGYNAIGNSISKTEGIAANWVYTYPAAGQMRPHAATGFGPNTYTLRLRSGQAL